jgi:hypothetical protein
MRCPACFSEELVEDKQRKVMLCPKCSFLEYRQLLRKWFSNEN